MAEINYQNTGQIVDPEDDSKKKLEPSEAEKKLVGFVVDHTDRWRDYRDQNYMEDWERYERTFMGKWAESDKTRKSERSRIISPATQQAVETRHAEMMESIFGQGEFFDIEDDLEDQDNSDVSKLKNQLVEDFKRDKIRKSYDDIELLAEMYGTGIGEIIVGKEKVFTPAQKDMGDGQIAYGVSERDRVCVKLAPVNPKNFLWDPNGTCVDDCMGVAVEKYVSIHKIYAGIKSGKYMEVDISSISSEDSKEAGTEDIKFHDEKVLLLTYYGLVPRMYLESEEVEKLLDEEEELEDMVEAIVVIANGSVMLKYGENPYSMKDRPIITFQDDTVPGKLIGRGTVEKASNMQSGIDGSMRSHLDSLALTTAPMMGIDATRIPRGMKFEIQSGKSVFVNGRPSEILEPMKFGMTDGMAMQTSQNFERMLLMSTNTIDSNGQVTQVSRDANLDMATATMIKKNKRALVNRQEDFIMPFVNKAAWRYMQFDPERYPSVDVKFMPTATLGIIAREHEQKQLAFIMQTLGADSPLTPILMASIIKNTSLTEREEIAQTIVQQSQPDPKMQEMQMKQMMAQSELVAAQVAEVKSKTNLHESQIIVNMVKAQLAPEETKAKVLSAISRNLPDEDAAANSEFDRRYKLAELMLQEKDIDSNEKIAEMQMNRKMQ